MKRGILFAVLITFHILWIGTMTMADAAGPMRIGLPDEVMMSSLLLLLWVGYQATSWARGAIQEKIK
ncbi:hypothetical protein B9G69_000935 [Bdellovibrio sp. SKB1291214]|uniref:hypothetical protein n=1 Tax=Bdellovibrio sp. SKB1291214 TaxID=1732569 RepID=UPI000B518DC0|nr:hypothetical protein [Bdellovibrio sp. SKB1291214]UYL09140.1 hypothetical protein B9G69_000935 [Bdellovibrio sp. SKB1291214]